MGRHQFPTNMGCKRINFKNFQISRLFSDRVSPIPRVGSVLLPQPPRAQALQDCLCAEHVDRLLHHYFNHPVLQLLSRILHPTEYHKSPRDGLFKSENIQVLSRYQTILYKRPEQPQDLAEQGTRHRGSWPGPKEGRKGFLSLFSTKPQASPPLQSANRTSGQCLRRSPKPTFLPLTYMDNKSRRRRCWSRGVYDSANTC